MNTETLSHTEKTPKFNPNYQVIELVGLAGTGTSTVGQKLAELHGARFFCVGDVVRKIHEKRTGESLVGARNHPMEIDEKMNRLGEIIIENFQKPYPIRTPIIVDSRLGALLAVEKRKQAEKDGKYFPNVIQILLIADEKVAAQRISQRQGISIKEAARKTRIRNRSDRKAINKVLPDQQKGVNMFDPKLFDVIINTNTAGIDEVVNKINEWMQKKGLLHSLS